MARRRTIDPNLFARTEGDAGAPSQHHTITPSSKRRAVTLYFDESTIAGLHAAWLAALAEDPKATKSAIAEAALRAYLAER